MISFFVQGFPVGQPRPRAFSRGGKARLYDPGTSNAWKETIAIQGRRYRPSEPLRGPLEVSIDFFLPRPKALMRKADPDGPVWAPVKPDRDNLDKAVLDALTDDGWWGDDAQACSGLIRKLYCAKTGQPGARITVSNLFPYSTAP